MKYIICAGRSNTEYPKQLLKVNGEVLVERTIRLLRENGVKDIKVSSSNPLFEKYGMINYDSSGAWINCFYPMDEPVCYVFGDVYFSEEAIKTIVETKTKSIEFFASAPPFAEGYPKRHAEPFAFKVVDTKWFKKSIERVRQLAAYGLFKREPVSWELWQIIKGTPINTIDYHNYTVINDYTCDVDHESDITRWRF
jgi:hypothetical protein